MSDKELAFGDLTFPELMLGRMKAVLSHDSLDALPGIRSETLVLCAGDDVVVPAYLSEQCAARIPACRMHRFAVGGHFYPEVIPGLFNTRVISFLES